MIHIDSPFDSLCSLRALDSSYASPARVRPGGLPRASGASRVAPRVGLEPTTLRLTVGCSTIELPGNLFPGDTNDSIDLLRAPSGDRYRGISLFPGAEMSRIRRLSNAPFHGCSSTRSTHLLSMTCPSLSRKAVPPFSQKVICPSE